jgi:hypothetical protein
MGSGRCRAAASFAWSSTPASPFFIYQLTEVLMDISVVATIGFTAAAVIGIIVLVFTGTGKKKTSQN